MAVAVSDAMLNGALPLGKVVGVDEDTPIGRPRIKSVNEGRFPFATLDSRLKQRLSAVVDAGILSATGDPEVYTRASTVIVDVNFDGPTCDSNRGLDFTGFERAIRTVASRMPPGGLVIIETTVPPGTTENVVVPTVKEELALRGLPFDAIDVAHSYERVMPGKDYLDSITNYWRVYSGVTDRAARRCADLLSGVIDTGRFPLTRLASPTASELAKVLENSFRAVNIALMDEWGAFAEQIGVDIFSVLEAVRLRPTHTSIREPGLGVGGYCLTKDPLFASLAAEAFWPEGRLEFPLTNAAVSINQRMPSRTVNALLKIAKQPLDGMRTLVVGASYREDVGDTRNSPSATLVRMLAEHGSACRVFDPLARDWHLGGVTIESVLPPAHEFDAVIFTVSHAQVRSLDVSAWLGTVRPLVVDANHVLSAQQLSRLADLEGLQIFSIGRGILT